MANNVFGTTLKPCSQRPVTGFYRDGICRTGEDDYGTHTVCAVMTEEFLRFSFDRGNDLITPMPQYRFPGLGPGDRWCLCALRWKEAFLAGVAPPVILEATNESTLRLIDLEDLVKHAYSE
ncbi:MAG: DUF2237 domain-containing protein [Bacteroidales bacterium]|nr:DUF2237 domain-containing protein [Bacteroidales bacterium]